MLVRSIYIEYNTNSGYKCTPQEVIYVKNNFEGPRIIQYK